MQMKAKTNMKADDWSAQLKDMDEDFGKSLNPKRSMQAIEDLPRKGAKGTGAKKPRKGDPKTVVAVEDLPMNTTDKKRWHLRWQFMLMAKH